MVARLVLLLCLAVAQAENRVQELVHWLETNGPELAETSAQCAKAMSLANGLHKECGMMNFDPEGMAGLAAWAILDALEHMQVPMAGDVVNSSLAKFFKGSATNTVEGWDRSRQEFCGRSDCAFRLEDFDTSYRTCLSSAMCAALAKEIPYQYCKKTLELFMHQQIFYSLPTMCSKSSAGSFCLEERSRHFLQNPRCYVGIVWRGMGICSAECARKRAQAQNGSPRCTSDLELTTEKLAKSFLEFLRDFLGGANDPKVRGLTRHLLYARSVSIPEACMTQPPGMVSLFV